MIVKHDTNLERLLSGQINYFYLLSQEIVFLSKMDEEDDDVPQNAEKLSLMVSDLTRRLRNAQHTIEAERNIARNALMQAELYRLQLGEVTKLLRLESAKAFNLEQKALQHTEGSRFESNKQKAAKLHEQLRIAELDHMMTGNKREPLKLTKLRKRVQSLEEEQDSQKVFLQELTEIDGLSEALLTAAQMGELEECGRLLRCGAWTNFVDSAGFMALHYAARNGHYDVAKLLIEFGADPTSYLTGQSPLVIAASNGHISIIKLLLEFGANLEDSGMAGCPATIAALLSGQYDTLEFLLNVGASVHSIDANENSLLHLATRIKGSSCPQLISFLTERGADTERVNRNGHSPLQMALHEKNKIAFYALGGKDIDSECNTFLDTGTTNQESKSGKLSQQFEGGGGKGREGGAMRSSQQRSTGLADSSEGNSIHVDRGSMARSNRKPPQGNTESQQQQQQQRRPVGGPMSKTAPAAVSGSGSTAARHGRTAGGTAQGAAAASPSHVDTYLHSSSSSARGSLSKKQLAAPGNANTGGGRGKGSGGTGGSGIGADPPNRNKLTGSRSSGELPSVAHSILQQQQQQQQQQQHEAERAAAAASSSPIVEEAEGVVFGSALSTIKEGSQGSIDQSGDARNDIPFAHTSSGLLDSQSVISGITFEPSGSNA